MYAHGSRSFGLRVCALATEQQLNTDFHRGLNRHNSAQVF